VGNDVELSEVIINIKLNVTFVGPKAYHSSFDDDQFM